MAQAKTLTQAELDRVLAYIAGQPNAQRNRAMLLLTVWAGLRVGEVAGLTIADVRNADGSVKSEVFLSAERVKHAHARTVYISLRLQRELKVYIASRNWHEDSQALFCTQQKPRKGFTPNTMTQHFHYLYKRAGFRDLLCFVNRRLLFCFHPSKFGAWV